MRKHKYGKKPISISQPFNAVNKVHVTYDAQNKCLKGLPREWEEQVNDCLSKSEINCNVDTLIGVAKFLNNSMKIAQKGGRPKTMKIDDGTGGNSISGSLSDDEICTDEERNAEQSKSGPHAAAGPIKLQNKSIVKHANRKQLNINPDNDKLHLKAADQSTNNEQMILKSSKEKPNFTANAPVLNDDTTHNPMVLLMGNTF
ncbi:hypothetical protein ACOME3_007372 [Neoechinorhynchus agilis]